MRRLFLLLGALVVLGALAAPAFAQVPEKLNVFLYVDTVNGTRPVGAKPRPIGCTQTNVFQRGEQVVFRIWGSEADTGAVLSTELGCAWSRHAPRLVLDDAVDRSGGLPARRGHRPNRVQDRGEQVRALRLPDDDQPDRRQEAAVTRKRAER